MFRRERNGCATISPSACEKSLDRLFRFRPGHFAIYRRRTESLLGSVLSRRAGHDAGRVQAVDPRPPGLVQQLSATVIYTHVLNRAGGRCGVRWITRAAASSMSRICRVR
jgi:hypothetical protein